jgi:membrane-associated phospholipid phosphatase
LAHTDANLDTRLLRLARTCAHTPRAERLIGRYSRLGEHGALWLTIGCAGQLLDGDRRAGWRRATGVVAGTYVLNTAIKLVVRRRRPQLPDLPALTGTPTALSFPSAHTATGFAGALAYSRMGAPAPALYALAVTIALSRLYLGVHYPSDILAGALLGTAVAGACTRPGR